MQDYDGPAINRDSKLSRTLSSSDSKSKPFEPAFKKEKNNPSKRPRLKTWDSPSQFKTYRGVGKLEDTYKIPFLKEKDKDLTSKFSPDRQAKEVEFSEKAPEATARSGYQPSLSKRLPFDKDFISSQEPIDLEEDKAYHKTARQKYQPSFQPEITDIEDDNDNSLIETDLPNHREASQENEDEEESFVATELPKPYKAKEPDRIDQNARELSRRLAKSKDSFILFDHQEEI